MALQHPLYHEPTFDELFDDAVGRIPRLAPIWTDQNLHDPGITLLEHLAYLTEAHAFRAGRITSEHERHFLAALGSAPEGLRVARTVLSLSATRPIPLPRNTAVSPGDDSVIFTTDAELPIEVVQMRAIQPAEQAEVELAAPGAFAAPVLPFGREPALEATCEWALSGSLRTALQLYVWTGKPDHDELEMAGLREAAARVHEDPYRHHGASTRWEVLGNGRWRAIETVDDRTRAFSCSGMVSLSGASLLAASAAPSQPWRIRTRLVRVAYDEPPALAAVVVNAVAARNLAPVVERELHFGGRANEVVSIVDAPVASSSIEEIRERIREQNVDVAGPTWHAVRFWDGGAPDKRWLQLDELHGTLRASDGSQGQVPGRSSKLQVRARAGGGTRGNLRAGSLTRVHGHDAVTCLQPFAAHGGADPETLADAQRRTLVLIAAPERLVTLEDYENHARTVPGTRVARAWALAERHPDLTGLVAAGCITVYLIARYPNAKPAPSRELLRTVERSLRQKSPWGTRVYSAAPDFVKVSVNASLLVELDATQATIRTDADAALRAYLSPFAGGGPEQTGWPLGRGLFRSELVALLAAIGGVRAVFDLTVTLDDGAPNACPSVALCGSALPVSGVHTFSLRTEDTPR